MGVISKVLGGRRQRAPAPMPQGPSAEEIRQQEQQRMEEENLARLQEQEEGRSRLRRRALLEDEDAVQRKRLFGE